MHMLKLTRAEVSSSSLMGATASLGQSSASTYTENIQLLPYLLAEPQCALPLSACRPSEL